MKSAIFFSTLCIVLQGCIITNTPGFYSGYSRMSPLEKEKVIFTDTSYSICNLGSNSKIYAISGFQLYDCIENQQKSVVYIWSPNCHADECYSLKLVQDYCSINNYALFVVALYYDSSIMSLQGQYLTQYPMFSINEQYYQTRYCNKYYKQFIYDLLENQIYNKNDIYNNYYIFEKGKLVSFILEL